jgi:ubiquinone/menaquinone biosynthesis C-methylase UbiE
MDSYTLETKDWLDERFRQTDEAGIFKAHQPIYGFRKGHFDPSYASRYIPSYHIMKSLSRLKFAHLVDVGGAEGYKAYMAQRLFGIGAENSDLSAEACKRAEEIFHVKSTPVDIHKLPFADGEFDVVMCSETLEHVAELEGAVDEVLRVAKKAVVITVPHEDQDTVEKHVIEGKSHGHIHSFDLASFDYLEARGYEVIAKKIMSKRVLDYART